MSSISSVANGISSASSGALKQQVGIAVLAKSLDVTEQQGRQLVQLMEQSVHPHLGKNLDIKV
ncbi:YjfB family protein [Cohnella cholangitidis]|uniref:Putative motility protein n=1 Tax=Cohnella cholangitidis TaxID=2598458 RepID=A0A7G5C1X4_9BACL|nr:YjfB family protein [Cohnella cholangitidis]QMV43208.1 putative motility protein [Cohnella cholangitidis]